MSHRKAANPCWLSLLALVVACCCLLAEAIPSSLVQEIKNSEARSNKVKRARSADALNTEENEGDIPYYSKLSAAKRGVNLDEKNVLDQQQSPLDSSDWTQQDGQSLFHEGVVGGASLPSIPSSLYNSPENNLDDKTIAEYEKGFRYGTSKDALDEALQNAVLKSELYGEPSSINQYRYYGGDDRRRKRRSAKKFRLESRLKRDVDLSPEEILALLSLYDNKQRQQLGDNYRRPWNRYEQNLDLDLNPDELQDQDDENWLDTPVNPHSSIYDRDMSSKYMVDTNNLPPVYEKNNGRWEGTYGNVKNKRFMVSKKRSMDPTRELRYLNGPNKNDFYTLSQLLSHQREPNVPVYRRLIL
nr:unnamed protein product [Callosobruchus chinensis]